MAKITPAGAFGFDAGLLSPRVVIRAEIPRDCWFELGGEDGVQEWLWH